MTKKETYETFKNLVKPEYWEEVKDRIRNKNANKELQIYRYNIFKELAKLMLSYKTYFKEKYERKNNIAYTCPTCGKNVYSKGQLTIHRKTTKQCMENIGKK